MKSMAIKCVAVLASLVFLQAAHAQRVEVNAVGTYAYDAKQAEGRQFATSKPTEDEKSKAVTAARQSAWKIYVSNMNPARQQAIFKHEKALLEQLGDFITDQTVLDAAKGTPNRASLKVAVRFAFNDERVARAIQALTVGDDKSAAASGGSTFSFLFLSRKATSIQQFDARKTAVTQTESATVKARDGGATSTNSSTTGGSTIQKEDTVTYEVTSAEDLDSAIGENLNASGIEYVSYSDVVANCNAMPSRKFSDDFVKSDEMTPETRKAIIAALRSADCNVKYFLFGTVDTGVADVDPVTGNKRVYVSVRSQLWDITQKLPRKLSSVGPKQFAGVGPNQSVASKNALNVAARDVSRTLVDQLNAKGIR